MDIVNIRTWVAFYLIAFVVLLWALFLTATGMMMWIGLMLVIIIIGINCMIIIGELRAVKNREEQLRRIAKIEKKEENDED